MVYFALVFHNYSTRGMSVHTYIGGNKRSTVQGALSMGAMIKCRVVEYGQGSGWD